MKPRSLFLLSISAESLLSLRAAEEATLASIYGHFPADHGPPS